MKIIWFSLFIVIFRSLSEWMHKCGNHNHWKAIWSSIIANRTGGQWIWYRIIRMSSAGYLFRGSKWCFEATLDWHWYGIDGHWFAGIFIAAFSGRCIPGNECRNEYLLTRKFNQHGKYTYIVTVVHYLLPTMSTTCLLLHQKPFTCTFIEARENGCWRKT